MSFLNPGPRAEPSDLTAAERLQAVVSRSRAEKASYALQAKKLALAKSR